MLMTLTATHEVATDLGFLLRKNPARSQSFGLSFGKAHVFYPEATPERCTVALLMEFDQRLAAYDAAAEVEVIEHFDAARLAAFKRVLFECAKPKHIVITTPNANTT